MSIYEGTENLKRASQARRPFPLQEMQMSPKPKGLSILILNLDRADLMGPLLKHLSDEFDRFSTHHLNFEVLIGDTGSTEPELLSLYAGLKHPFRVFTGLHYQFSKNNNQLAELATTDTLLFLNNDVIAPQNEFPFFQMRDFLQTNADYSVLGSLLYFPDERVQHAGVAFMADREPLPFHKMAGEKIAVENFPLASACTAVTGACLMIKYDLFARLGGFDPEFEREAQDVDLCLKAVRQGEKISILNLGKLLHIENATRPKNEIHRPDRALFLRRWSTYIRAFDL